MAVVGAGLVGLSLAYELACLGASVTVVDAAHRGRATDAGAGILSPATSHETDGQLWPFLEQAGAHYPQLLRRLEADGADVDATGYGVCGLLSLGLREHEDSWFAPFAEIMLRRSNGKVAEISPLEASGALPASRHRAPRPPLQLVGAGGRAGHGRRAARRRAARGRCLRRRPRCTASRPAWTRAPRGAAPRHLGGSRRTPQRRVRSPCRRGRGVDGGHGGVARARDCPSARPRARSCTSAWTATRAAGRSRSHCSRTTSCPGPGAGWPAAARSSPARATRSRHRGGSAASCCASACSSRRASPSATYGETRVGLRPTSADDRALVGALPGWSNVWVATGHGANGLLQGPYRPGPWPIALRGPSAG